MRYFVGSEVGVANLLQRHFDWSSNALWYDEIPNARDPSKTFFLVGGKDDIVNAISPYDGEEYVGKIMSTKPDWNYELKVQTYLVHFPTCNDTGRNTIVEETYLKHNPLGVKNV